MTTIAYRNGILAADTLITEHDRRVGFVQKIGCVNGVLWGATGCLQQQISFNDWMRRGMQGAPPAMETAKGASTTVILIAEGRLLTFDEHGLDWMPLPAFYAVGSGAPLALGALAAGASAEEAVRAAMTLDLHTGGDVTVLHARRTT